MSKKIVVIGSNSFSGAAFSSYMLKKGYEITGMSRSTEPADALLPYKWVDNSKFTFHQMDINNDLSAMMEVIHDEKPEYIFNFSAQSMVAQSWENPEHWFMTNIISTVKLHDELRKCEFLKKFIHVTTPEVYGNCEGFVKENYPFNPSTPYAVSRAAGDMSLKTFVDNYNFPAVSTRAANVFGAGQQLYRIIPRMVLFIRLGKKLQLHGGGASIRSFIHIDDVSEATLKIAEDGVVGETYHISTDRMISIKDLVTLICEKMNVDFNEHIDVVDERPGKDTAYSLDSTKLRETLHWIDKITLEDGLDEVIDWIDENLEEIKKQQFDYIHKQ
jgi:dTDP-glucose 4,6-dehydratase